MYIFFVNKSKIHLKISLTAFSISFRVKIDVLKKLSLYFFYLKFLLMKAAKMVLTIKFQ